MPNFVSKLKSYFNFYFQKQDSKDTSIHKRLSWNQQQQPQATIPGNDLQMRTKQSKCLSTDSVQSSSGVSSTGSLHLSIGSEFDPAPSSSSSAVPGGAGVVTIGVSAANTPPIPPRGNHHVSTTYITQDSVIVRGSGSANKSEHFSSDTIVKSSSTKIMQGKSDRTSLLQSKVQGDTSKERTYLTLENSSGQRSSGSVTEQAAPEITINLPEAKESVSPVNISISSSQKSPEPEILKLREILLKDSSVEAS